MNKNTFSCTQVCDAIAPDKGLWQPHLSSAGVCETGTLIGEVAEQTKDNAAFLRGYLSMLTDSVKKHLALGERVTGVGLAMKIVDAFLNAEFEGGRHARRVALIGQIEEK